MMMRRYEIEEEEARRQPPFRVLSPGGRILYEPQAVLRSPPPPRAPEPYKVGPQAAGLGRAQRKSSFAIIAETRPPSPQPPDGQPASGRISPFRGRGFKGPPPRSHSRPHTPDRRGSASQQSSPKRSQIPRPARSRSVSSSKENLDTRKDSPKFGRRATNRYTSSIGNATAQQRRAPQRDAKLRSELSPIRGTPTKGSPSKTKGSPTKGPSGPRPGARPTKTPDKLNRNLLVPPPRNATGKRFVTAKTPMPRDKSASAEALDSAGSRIPLRQANGANGSTSNLLKVSPAKSTAANSKPANDANDRAKPTSNGNGPDIVKPIPTKRQSPSTKDSGGAGEEDLALVDLLRQSSGATGTSSVVNTTTTTAVQPLQIDAASILPEGELVAKLTSLERKQRLAEARERSPDRPQQEAEAPPGGAGSGSREQQQQPTKSETPRDGGGAKGDIKATRGDARATRDGGAKANMTQTMIKHFGQGAAEDKGTSRTSEAAGNESKTSPKADEKARDEAASKRPVQQEQQQQQEQEKQRQAATAPTGQTKPTPTAAAKPDTKTAIVAVNGNGSKRTSPTLRQGSARTADKKPAATNIGAQAQAVSSESLGSLRSTDTGVSLNTVRGVSSAKEKAGLHLVKRPEEIETLSGNIVHLDRNGEHPPIASRDGAGGGGDGGKGGGGGGGGGGAAATGGGDEAPRTRWQRLRSRCPGKLGTCWPDMRCLACKRDPKAQLWPGKQARASSTAQLTPGDAKPPRWSRIKNAFRCAKLREGRCWRRRQQRARQPWPSRQDAARGGCGLGALCRKLLGRCSCRREARAAEQRKSVRAKPSLTSVRAPPLSEETRPKLPDVLVEHNSVMRGAIPCLPVPVAWFCLIWNVVVPGSGTILSGLFNLCMGQPRFSPAASPKARFGAFIVNIIVGVSQLFTVLFCLVGWGWSIWWGVSMVRLAGKYKRFKDSEAAANDPEARGAEAGASLPAPGVPAQMLRGVERPAR